MRVVANKHILHFVTFSQVTKLLCIQAPANNDLMSVLGSLPGVNPDDPALQTALRNLQGGNPDKSEDKKDAK